MRKLWRSTTSLSQSTGSNCNPTFLRPVLSKLVSSGKCYCRLLRSEQATDHGPVLSWPPKHFCHFDSLCMAKPALRPDLKHKLCSV